MEADRARVIRGNSGSAHFFPLAIRMYPRPETDVHQTVVALGLFRSYLGMFEKVSDPPLSR